MQCPLCGKTALVPIISGRDWLMQLPGTFAVWKCEDCSTFSQQPVPSEEMLIHHYPPQYGPYSTATGLANIAARNGLRRRERDVLSVHLSAGSILDIGCGPGMFLERMRRRGWECSGIELNSEIAERARAKFGLMVATGTLESAGVPNCAFDVVTLWDVLEHVRFPGRTMREIARVLRPGGWLIFRVPNPESTGARIFGRFWAGWDLPRHLWVAPQAAIETALRETGFHLRRTSNSTGRFSLVKESIRHTFREEIGAARIPGAMLSAAGWCLARVITAPYFAVSSVTGRGSLLTYFAQRI